MQISVSKNNVNFEPREVKRLEDFGKLTQEFNWSPALFKDNYRNIENFLKEDCIGLDVDAGMTLEEAREAFKEYKHVIMPSRSHRKEKHGVVADRFRVVLWLSRPIESQKEHYATWYFLKKQFPAIDDACQDPSRMYYPSKAIISSNMQGKLVEPSWEHGPDIEAAKEILAEMPLKEDVQQQHGELSRKTLKFMQQGCRPGQRHRELYLAARDYLQNNYTQERFLADLQSMIERTGNWTTRKINSKDAATVSDAFSKAPKHEARYSYEKALIFEPISEVLNCEEKFEWLADSLLSVGGVSIIAGDPKAGKSTLIRQLAKAVARGEDFLGRKVKKGTVYYWAVEEHKALLKDQFKTLGINDKDDLFIHVGDAISGDVLPTLADELVDNKVSLLVVDTFMLGLGVKELQNYRETNEAIRPFRNLARDTGTHILFIHHTSKLGTGFNAVSGSKAITGAMDTVMVMRTLGKNRDLSATGRGVKQIHEMQLIYNPKTMTYQNGPEGGFDEDDSF